ncbi:MAG: capsule assembly Wzi family protein [Silvibacterium sp.]|nr:capsule assembly Wzi family protein [Silvibacterium sp.]
MDSWVYPALDRLRGLGYIDTAYMGLRPWTRLSISHMLQLSADKIDNNVDDEEAREIYLAVQKKVSSDIESAGAKHVGRAEFESAYTILRGITGTPLRDSFHLGQTIINDYGRPYGEGFNNYTGFSARAEAGRFSLYFRGEYQHSPAYTGYPLELAELLANYDFIPLDMYPVQSTLPYGRISGQDRFRVLEALLSYHFWGHEISFGKNDHWWSPDTGGAMLQSNNAENTYAFEINRVEPLRIPVLSRLTGPFRYDFFVGSVPGHQYPIQPYEHALKFSFKPTKDLEFGFSRTVVWGGKNRLCLNSTTGVFYYCNQPITLHTFLKSFFSLQNVSEATKFSKDDPGARFSQFDFTWRLPFLRNWLTLYTDSVVHDDLSPVSAPRRSAVRPGLYLSHFPMLPKLDLRVEGASTDPVSDADAGGNFLYYETVQKQGPTINGSLFADWIGRDGKGGQGWLTYHLSANEYIQFQYRNAKVDAGFIPGGTTQNVYEGVVQKRFFKDIELQALFAHEGWKAPVYKSGLQSDNVIQGRITWFPEKQVKF